MPSALDSKPLRAFSPVMAGVSFTGNLMRLFLVLTVILASGCDKQVFNFLESLQGIKTNTVVLTDKPTSITSSGLSLTSNEKIQAVGKRSSICLVLDSNIHSTSSDNVFNKHMHNKAINVTVTTKNNESIALSNLGQSWEMYGKVFEKNELSACYSDCCSGIPSVGSEITEISINSFSPIPVKGIYWESTNRYD